MKPKNRSSHLAQRPGFTLAEASVGLALALVGAGLVAQMVVSGLRHTRHLEERFVAQEELTNLKERCLAAGDSGRAETWPGSQKLSAFATTSLAGATLSWKRELVPLDGGLKARASDAPVRWSVELKWKRDDGGFQVATTSWVVTPTKIKLESGTTSGGQS